METRGSFRSWPGCFGARPHVMYRPDARLWCSREPPISQLQQAFDRKPEQQTLSSHILPDTADYSQLFLFGFPSASHHKLVERRIWKTSQARASLVFIARFIFSRGQLCCSFPGGLYVKLPKRPNSCVFGGFGNSPPRFGLRMGLQGKELQIPKHYPDHPNTRSLGLLGPSWSSLRSRPLPYNL